MASPAAAVAAVAAEAAEAAAKNDPHVLWAEPSTPLLLPGKSYPHMSPMRRILNAEAMTTRA